jgi:bacterial/archaeal transporter family-2 protein
MIIGLLLAILAGVLVSMQNIFNSKVSEKTGPWETTILVLGLGALASFTIGIFVEGKSLFILQDMQLWFWFSGLLGIGVVTSLVLSIRLLGPTFAIAIVLTSELGIALLFDSLGWLGLAKVPFTLNQLIGVLIIVSGIYVFKFNVFNREASPSNEKLDVAKLNQNA